MLITSKGQNVRIRVGGEKGIRETGRNAQGVKLMDLKKDETIQDVATVIADEEDEVADEATTDEVVTGESVDVIDTPADESSAEA
jgi:DNA gyrase subunit A